MTTVCSVPLAAVGVGSGQPGGVVLPPEPDEPPLASLPASTGALPPAPLSGALPADPAAFIPPLPAGAADGEPPSPLGGFDVPLQASDSARDRLQPTRADSARLEARRSTRPYYTRDLASGHG